MCNYFSCIITKDFKVHWSKKSVAHETIIAETKLEDKKLENREFVRIEISPKDTAKLTRNPDDWNFKVDEEETLPEWFIENRSKAEKACWKAWEQSVQIQLGLNDEHKGKLTDTLVFLHDSSSAELYGSSSAELKSTRSVAISKDKIFVHEEATIKKTSKVKAEEA